jgi:hypothetical protein
MVNVTYAYSLLFLKKCLIQYLQQVNKIALNNQVQLKDCGIRKL